MRQRSICFIDEDPAELKRFKECFASRFAIGVGQSIDDAIKNNGGSTPDLFVLDLYFPNGPLLNAKELATLHEGRAKYLAEQRHYQAILTELRQSAQAGFRLARDVRSRFKRPAVFFTRKGTLEDAIEAYEDVGIAVVKKPDPELAVLSPEALPGQYDDVLRESAVLLSGRFNRAIREATWWWRHREAVVAFVLGIAASVVAALLMKAAGVAG